MSKFQFIILGIFVVFIIGGVIAFARFKGTSTSSDVPPITVWGTYPADVFDQYVSNLNNAHGQNLKITYVQKSQAEFSRDFISALARGQGPDAVLVTVDTLLPHSDKLAVVPYESFPQRTFIDSYVQEGNIYLSSGGILGIPFMIDPLVMYWNRDIFDAAGIASYPHYWDEFSDLNKKLTVKDKNGNIRKTAIALGDFSNITNAREILATLIFQTGNPITAPDQDGLIASTLNNVAKPSPAPAIQFFTQALDPSSSSYSWNRSLPESKTAFLSGTLATYFGFASELHDLRNKNPNINFDVAMMPQIRSGGNVATYAKMYGFSFVRTSPNIGAALQSIMVLTQPEFLKELSDSLYLPSVRRDIIAQNSNDPYITIFNQAALIGKSWIDVDPLQSNAIFDSLSRQVTSGEKTIEQAIQDASDQYDIVLRQAVK